MPRNSIFRTDLKAITTHLEGLVRPLEFVSGVATSLAFGACHGTSRFLSDCTGLAGGFSLANVCEAAGLVEMARIERAYTHAIVVSPVREMAEAAHLWKGTCAARRLTRVELFDSSADAESWLAWSLAC